MSGETDQPVLPPYVRADQLRAGLPQVYDAYDGSE
jgi:hypothetical protein